MKTLTLKAGTVINIQDGVPARLLADVQVECATFGTEQNDALAEVDAAVEKGKEAVQGK
jgi:hypothetical protein